MPNKADCVLHGNRPSSDYPPFFEFFCNDYAPDRMPPAEDIIFCGKLLHNKITRRSLSQPTASRHVIPEQRVRTCRTLDSRKMDQPSVSGKSSQVKVGQKSTQNAKAKRWWPVLGLVEIPQQMELRDIKNRQNRRNQIMASRPTAESLASKGYEAKGPWAIVRTLSCKDDATVAVTASFGWVRPV